MRWMQVLDAEALPEGARETVKVEDHTILLIHHEGEIYATLNACPHMRLPLKGGKITSEDAIVCPFHRSAFDLNTGEVKEWTPWPPGVGKVLGAISNEKRLHVFPTKIEDGKIWLDLEG